MKSTEIFILFTTPSKPKLFSGLIKLLQGTKYSHMVICYRDKFGEFVVDASGLTVRTQEMKKFLAYNSVVKSRYVGPVNKKEFKEFYLAQLGKKYDFKSLFGLALKSLGLISFNTIGSNYKKLICSELVIMFLERFFNAKVKDSDNFGLKETERVLNDICKK